MYLVTATPPTIKAVHSNTITTANAVLIARVPSLSPSFPLRLALVPALSVVVEAGWVRHVPHLMGQCFLKASAMKSPPTQAERPAFVQDGRSVQRPLVGVVTALAESAPPINVATGSFVVPGLSIMVLLGGCVVVGTPSVIFEVVVVRVYVLAVVKVTVVAFAVSAVFGAIVLREAAWEVRADEGEGERERERERESARTRERETER